MSKTLGGLAAYYDPTRQRALWVSDNPYELIYA